MISFSILILDFYLEFLFSCLINFRRLLINCLYCCWLDRNVTAIKCTYRPQKGGFSNFRSEISSEIIHSNCQVKAIIKQSYHQISPVQSLHQNVNSTHSTKEVSKSLTVLQYNPIKSGQSYRQLTADPDRNI